MRFLWLLCLLTLSHIYAADSASEQELFIKKKVEQPKPNRKMQCASASLSAGICLLTWPFYTCCTPCELINKYNPWLEHVTKWSPTQALTEESDCKGLLHDCCFYIIPCCYKDQVPRLSMEED